MTQPSAISVLAKREAHRDWYDRTKDPILGHRLLWQAQAFRHMVHLLPGETILELGAGAGRFTASLQAVSRGRNPITSATFGTPADGEQTHLDALPGMLKGRRFRYVVAQNILDRENAAFLLHHVYRFLEPGGQVVFFESNPWNPVFAVRSAVRRLLGRPVVQSLFSQPELYELISEIGFVRISAHFTDFVYRPIPAALMRLFGNLSVVLENMPFVRTLAGRIVLHAQRPPLKIRSNPVSLAGHPALMGQVSVVVPCHDEEANVVSLVNGLRGLFDPYICQIVLVDDNSRDGTRQLIERLAKDDPRIAPLIRTPPGGVGHALRDGYKAATGGWILSMDCDFQHLLPELEDMFDAAAGGADAVVGSRFSRHSLLINYPLGKIVANRAFHMAFNLLFWRWSRDLTNNLKLMRADMARRLDIREPGFAANAEVGLQLALGGRPLKEVPISWINRTYDMGQSSFRVLRAGGGYARVLVRLARKTRFGRRPLGPAPRE